MRITLYTAIQNYNQGDVLPTSYFLTEPPDGIVDMYKNSQT